MAWSVASLIVDASALYEALTGTDRAPAIRERMIVADELAAPHVIDVEVLGIVRRDEQRRHLDATAARQAVEDLAAWPALRYDHRPFFARAWALRSNVRTWDAMYVALAEALDGTLLTTDARLAAATGPACPIEIAG
jgi:predicted nucleic acid-binding protein